MMRCPSCGEPLQAIAYEGVSIHTCEGCGGEFAAGDALKHIVRTRDEQFDAPTIEALRDWKPRFGMPAEHAERTLNCPECCVPMGIHNYGGDTGVVVDRCSQCGGVWLDHQELEHVQALMERWADEAPAQLQAISQQLEQRRQATTAQLQGRFNGSRFAFVNAIINRFLDAA